MRSAGRRGSTAGGGAAWNPIVQLSALHGWDMSLQAGADASAFVTAADLVVGANARALGLYGIGGTTAPKIRANAQNGRKMLEFIAATPSDGIKTAAFAATLAQPFWHFVVSSAPAADAVRYWDSTQAGVARVLGGQSGGLLNFYAGSVTLQGSATDNNVHSYAYFLNGAASVLYRDNVSILTGNPGTNGMDGIVFGRDNAGAVAATMLLGESWLAPSAATAGAAPSAGELARAMQFYTQYAKSKWGLV